MVSKYFELKTSREYFKRDTENLIGTLKDKKILIYGADAGFPVLVRDYNLTGNLNIVAISDKKFNSTRQSEFEGIRAVTTEQMVREDFDYVLVASERSRAAASYLVSELGIPADKIRTIFCEKIKDEAENLEYLYDCGLDKTLPKLVKKLKNKKVVLYGAGAFLELIKEYFDISELNIVAVSDKRFAKQGAEGEFLGYKAIAPNKIREVKPDCVLVATKFYVRIIEDLHDNLLKCSGIRLRPLVKKSFLVLFKEMRNV